MKKNIILLCVTTSVLSCQNKSKEDRTEKENMKLKERIELSENDTDTLYLYHLTETNI